MLPGSSVVSRAVLLVCLSALAGSACAQLRTDPSRWGAGRDGIKLHSDEVIDLRTTAPKPIDPHAYKRGLFSSIGLYEYRPAGAVPGQYTRPHYAFGLQSELMRDALSLAGLEAESCIAPMLRLRARQTTITGTTGISMSVLARCTFY
ncbi:MAG: hypothetical protein ACXW2G_14310 [Burkholderiaceae bacterium]